MYSSFFGLQIATKALAAQQAALNVTGHNIANANTKGYTRQIANIQTTTPLTIKALGKDQSLGSGATVDSILRARESFVDRQFRWENSKQEYWVAKEGALGNIESITNEPSDYGLHSALSQFWNSWSTLANNPQNVGARSILVERATSLANTFNHIDRQITDIQKDLDTSVQITIQQINTLADQIKDLNIQIKRAEVGRDNPNDLKDKRDSLIDELSKHVAVRVEETQDPAFTDRPVGVLKITIGNEDPNNVLVNDQTIRRLQNPPDIVNGFSQVAWEDDTDVPKNDVDLGKQMGKLSAQIEMRDGFLVEFRAKYDTLAQGIANGVNYLHQGGQGLVLENPIGISFFVDGSNPSAAAPPVLPTVTAANIAINPDILANNNRIATGKINDPLEVGDTSVALAIASLADGWSSLTTSPIAASSYGDYYGSMIAKLGVMAQQSQKMADGQRVLVNHMENQRESISGVSLDEEMANLIRFQKSYGAAARLVTILDSMYERILGMGVTR